MISLHSEMTDSKGQRASRGWVVFDRDCQLCTSLAQRFRDGLEHRGFGLAALQDPRVAAHLRLKQDELLREMCVLTAEGKVYGGADAVIFLASKIWWAWPLYAAAQIPGARRILRVGYQWVADHRYCFSSKCSLATKSHRSNILRPAKGEPK
jgi:predicted DCC family thiol-disulfide oxidoreductase YuxK